MQAKDNRFQDFIKKHQKYAPIIFFVGGFIWDSLTLGRIDRLYDRVVLSSYLILLTVCLYVYNVAEDGRWKDKFIERYEEYLPLAIQFFLGGLSSAYVIYFSRSVSLTKTAAFFIILVILLFANELLKKRISNKYLQFSFYFFVNFTFLTFFIPVLIKHMNTSVFMISGFISLTITFGLVIYIYAVSPSTRYEIHLMRMLGLVTGIYLMINTFYFFNLIPPVPLALQTGMAAHSIEKKNGNYIVGYEKDIWYKFWRENRIEYSYQPGDNVYVFSSIFAPSRLEKSISHRWKWLSPHTNNWEVIEDIGFEITGGRDGGFRGYTYKSNMMNGNWRVDVITEEELVLGVIDFKIEIDSLAEPKRLIKKIF